MLKKILIGVVAVLVLAVAFIAMQPSSYTVARATSVAAPPEAVYALVSDFQKWPSWSPWEELDPTMKKTFGGAAGTVGATYHWVSDKDDVGEGEMTITAVKPNESIDYKLEFIKPFASTNQTGFTLVPKDGATEVTWSMSGPKNFMMKAMMLFMDMDSMIGKDFEKGLARIKTQAEATGAAPMTATTAAGAATTEAQK